MPIPSQRGDMRSIIRWFVMVRVLILARDLSIEYSGHSSLDMMSVTGVSGGSDLTQIYLGRDI